MLWGLVQSSLAAGKGGIFWEVMKIWELLGKGRVKYFWKLSTSWGMRRVWKEFPTAANVEPDPSAMICVGI